MEFITEVGAIQILIKWYWQTLILPTSSSSLQI